MALLDEIARRRQGRPGRPPAPARTQTPRKTCAAPGCDQPATLSRGTRGQGPWLCRLHFWRWL